MPLADWLFRTSLAHPDLPAVALGPRAARSYADLARNANALAATLRGLKLKRNSPIAIVSENRVEIVETLFACWCAGHPAAPIDASLPAEEIAARLAFCDAEACFVSPRAATKTLSDCGPGLKHVFEYDGPSYRLALSDQQLKWQQAALPANNLAWLSFSDRPPGAPPRAAMMSFQALMSLTTSILAEIETVKPRDAQIHALPWTGAAGLMLLPALARGGVNVMPETGAFDPAEFFENAGKWRRASTLISALQLRGLLISEAKMRPEHFRTIEIGGLDLSKNLIDNALDRFGPRLARIFGHSAFPLGLTRLNSHDVSARSEEGWQRRIASVGRPFLSTQISIRSGDGPKAAKPGEVGWICARGLHGMRGYWKDRRSRVSHTGNQWRRLGLRGALDHRGYLRVLGQEEHLLVGRDGAVIAPDAIETALIDNGAADDLAVTRAPPSPSNRGTKKEAGAPARDKAPNDAEKLVLFLKNGPNARKAIEEGSGMLSIAAMYEVKQLPRGPSGRLHRATLQRWALEKAQDRSSEAAQNASAAKAGPRSSRRKTSGRAADTRDGAA